MNKPKGFIQQNRRIYFMEEKGKDVSFPRWRVCLYYAPNFALTHFLDSLQEYNNFLSNHINNCFADYEVFRKNYWASALDTEIITNHA